MRRVAWSEDALAEFEGIVAYIAKDNPAAATGVADRIERAIETLAFMPTGRRGRVAGTHEKPVSGLPYIIAYALGLTPGGEESLTIVRIIHGARDWREGEWPGAANSRF